MKKILWILQWRVDWKKKDKSEDYFSNQNEIKTFGLRLSLSRFVEVGKGEVTDNLNLQISELKNYGAIGSNREMGKCPLFYDRKKNSSYFTGDEIKL